MKKLFTIFLLTAAASGCAGFKPDYVVRDASENSRPSWIVQKNAHKSDDSGNKKNYRYYVGDAENPDQNLCLNLAESRATQKDAHPFEFTATRGAPRQTPLDRDRPQYRVHAVHAMFSEF